MPVPKARQSVFGEARGAQVEAGGLSRDAGTGLRELGRGLLSLSGRTLDVVGGLGKEAALERRRQDEIGVARAKAELLSSLSKADSLFSQVPDGDAAKGYEAFEKSLNDARMKFAGGLTGLSPEARDMALSWGDVQGASRMWRALSRKTEMEKRFLVETETGNLAALTDDAVNNGGDVPLKMMEDSCRTLFRAKHGDNQTETEDATVQRQIDLALEKRARSLAKNDMFEDLERMMEDRKPDGTGKYKFSADVYQGVKNDLNAAVTDYNARRSAVAEMARVQAKVAKVEDSQGGQYPTVKGDDVIQWAIMEHMDALADPSLPPGERRVREHAVAQLHQMQVRQKFNLDRDVTQTMNEWQRPDADGNRIYGNVPRMKGAVASMPDGRLKQEMARVTAQFQTREEARRSNDPIYQRKWLSRKTMILALAARGGGYRMGDNGQKLYGLAVVDKDGIPAAKAMKGARLYDLSTEAGIRGFCSVNGCTDSETEEVLYEKEHGFLPPGNAMKVARNVLNRLLEFDTRKVTGVSDLAISQVWPELPKMVDELAVQMSLDPKREESYAELARVLAISLGKMTSYNPKAFWGKTQDVKTYMREAFNEDGTFTEGYTFTNFSMDGMEDESVKAMAKLFWDAYTFGHGGKRGEEEGFGESLGLVPLDVRGRRVWVSRAYLKAKEEEAAKARARARADEQERRIEPWRSAAAVDAVWESIVSPVL